MEDNEQSNFESKSNNITIKKTIPAGLIIGLIVAVGAGAFFAGLYISNTNSDQISQKELDEAFAKLELQLLQDKQPTPQLQQQQPTTGPLKISADDDPVLGNPDATITIIEFSDYECPFCAKFHKDTLPQLKEHYISTGKVNFVYRDFPITSIHPNAIPTAHATECADDQNRFWEMHDKIFETQKTWKNLEPTESVELFNEYALDIGLDVDEFDSCMKSGKYLVEIRNDLNHGNLYGVSGTPAFFVGNEKIGFTSIPGAPPFSSFQKVIDGQLNK